MRKEDKIINFEAQSIYDKYLKPLTTLHDCIHFAPSAVALKRDQFIIVPNILAALLAIAYGQSQFTPKQHLTTLSRELKFSGSPHECLKLSLQSNKNLFENLIAVYDSNKKFKECRLKNRLVPLINDITIFLAGFQSPVNAVENKSISANNFLEFKTFSYAFKKNIGIFGSDFFSPKSTIMMRKAISSREIYTLEQVINFASCDKNSQIVTVLKQLGIIIPPAKEEVLSLLRQNNFLLPELQNIVGQYLSGQCH